MTLDEAIKKGRALDFAAREEWPMGEPASLREEAAAVLRVIDAHVAAAPAGERADLARSIMARLSGRAFKAGVQPKRKTA